MVAAPTSANGGRVAKNTTYLTLALIGQKILSALYIPIVAGLIGPTATGEYLGALSFINVFAIFIDVGLTPAFIRATARDQQQGQPQFTAIITFKLLSSVVVVAALLATVGILEATHHNHPNMLFVRWAAIGMVIDAMTTTMYGFFRGVQRLEYESVGTVLHRVAVMLVGLTALQLGASPVAVIIALLVGSSANFLYATFHLWRYGVNWRFSWHWPTLKPLLIVATPFGLAALFSAIYSNSDNIFLTLFQSHRAVGLYGTASKMINAFSIIPTALVAAIFPAMSLAFINDRERLQRIFSDAMRYLMIAVIPIMVIILTLGLPIILQFYKSLWVDAVWPLRMLAVAMPMLFLNYPVGYLLNAANRQTRNTINIAITVVTNIALNLIFIQQYSYKSVAVISVFSALQLLVMGLWYTRTIINIPVRELLTTLGKTLVAGLLLAGLGSILLPYGHGTRGILMVAAALGLTYIVLLGVLRIVRRQDVDMFLSRIRRT
ncbi:MAG: flippase [Candidatus Kerfeldbacteria bacterium]|nr:flippase [Candidatus Kerfeldbacteria bacterium]